MKYNINEIIKKLQKINDDELRRELKEYDLTIGIDKFNTAFSCYGTTKIISSLDVDMFRVREMPRSIARGIQLTSVIVLRAYTTFVYMRSNELEEKLDNVKEDSCLNTYKEIFRKGKKRNSSDTLAQHIRNSLCHGTFYFNDNLTALKFDDNLSLNDGLDISIIDFDYLCDSIYRFYRIAFEAKNKKTIA